MSEPSRLLEHARRCFELASKSANAKNIEIFAELGREYLRMAHEASAVAEAEPIQRVG